MQKRNTHPNKLAGQFSFVATILGTVAKHQDRYGIVFFPVRTPAKHKNALCTAADQLQREGDLASYTILNNGFCYCRRGTNE